MNRRGISYGAAAVLGLIATTACGGASSKINNNDFENRLLSNVWSCEISDGEISGLQTISFAGDGAFSERESLRLHSSDNGFEVAVNFNISISGRWRIVGDSLAVCYDMTSVKVVTDSASFTLRPTDEGADREALENVRGSMFSDLLTALETMADARYRPLSTKYNMLGKLSVVDDDTLLIQHNGQEIRLAKML
ncbi:MAG: hypothetical protein NC210_03425 [[Clostridium] fimetarium]|nr:hypothetical protein [Alistipes timonensis]MCM1405453.1 hypothetical protein [[Clostridium] fimetarium]